MDGRWVTALLLFVVPAVGIAATILWFSSNPIAILVALSAMILGAFYLLTYTESFA
jgi:hypothetical protein